jgi:hypothetical protein
MEEQQRQMALQQQASADAVGGIDHLDSLLAQLESKGKGEKNGGKGRVKPERGGAGSQAGQTPKEIETELRGEAVEGVEASQKAGDLTKSVVVEVRL